MLDDTKADNVGFYRKESRANEAYLFGGFGYHIMR